MYMLCIWRRGCGGCFEGRWRPTSVTSDSWCVVLVCRAAGVVDQAVARGVASRRLLRCKAAVASALTARWRGRGAHRAFHQQRTAAVAVQRCWRRFVERECDAVERCAATLIQRRYGTWRTRRAFTRLRAAVVILQARFRKFGYRANYKYVL